MRQIFRSIKEGFIGFFRHFSVSLSSLAVVTFTMLFLGIILLITDNMVYMTRNIETEIEVWVPIKYEYEDDIQQIHEDLQQHQYINRVTFTSKEEDLDLYISEYGEEYNLYTGEENPLHDSFTIQATEGQYLDIVVEDLREMDWPLTVWDGGEGTSQLLNTLSSIRFGGSILVVALLVLAVFLISNTIKLSIFSRQDEIEIMRIVGATNSFIRSPFLIEGLLIGLFGSIIPVLSVVFGYRYLLENKPTTGILSMINLSPAMPLVQNIAAIVLITSLTVGLVGSYISVTKHLRWTR